MSFAKMFLDRTKQVYIVEKSIEPAGAKGVYILKHPRCERPGYLRIENDISRQRREDIIEKGVHPGVIEETYVYPMLGGRNIAKWKVKSNEFMLVPHTAHINTVFPEPELQITAPETYTCLTINTMNC
jgi:hypothetical protein